jgi:hypothetical protein
MTSKQKRIPFQRFLIPDEIQAPRLPEAIQFLTAAAKERTQENPALVCWDPIFVLSAGWRSGSTLLQRLICSDKRVLLWGEPFEDSIPAPRLAATVENFIEGNAYSQYAIDEFSGDLSNAWIANLNPGIHAVRPAHLAYFETLFARTAQQRGFSRWGLKCVRLTAEHGIYLKWLYPEAKFLFLVRHPLLAYQSYKGKRWYTVRPNYVVDALPKFVGHWSYLVASFLRLGEQLGAMLIRYEDLINDPETVERLARFLDVKIQSEAFERKIDARKNKKPIRWWERQACRILAGDACRALGYKVSGETMDWNAECRIKWESGKVRK